MLPRPQPMPVLPLAFHSKRESCALSLDPTLVGNHSASHAPSNHLALAVIAPDRLSEPRNELLVAVIANGAKQSSGPVPHQRAFAGSSSL